MQLSLRLGVLLCAFLAPGAVLVILTSPSNAQVLSETRVETFAQAPNLQGDPNRERLLPGAPNPEPLAPEVQPSLQPAPTPESSPTPTVGSIEVKKIEVKGSTIFSSKELNAIIQPFEGRSTTQEELKKALDAITQLYLNGGYLTSRAVLGQINDGVVEIRVIEGSLERIDIQGTRRVYHEYVRSRVNLGAAKPLSLTKLEDQLKLLRADPLFANVEASIRAGSREGKSILRVRVTEANPFNASASVDNYSPPSVGSERLGISAAVRNVTGAGDEFAASYYRTAQGGANTYDLSYKVPMNAMNGTLQLRGVINDNKVIQPPFDAFDISGESKMYEVSFRQPLIRTTREEFALSLGFTTQSGQTYLGAEPIPFSVGPDKDGYSRTSVVKFGQDYTKRDVQGAWGLRSALSFGTGLFDATVNSGSIPDGRFFSWLMQAQRVQRLDDNNLLIAQADLQLTPNGLLPSQQFVIGGGQSVRGFRQNSRAGDNGLRFSLENRITVQRDGSGNAMLQLAPFFDMGYTWNVDDNPNRLQNQTFIAGAGLGVLWKPLPSVNVRLDYGLPLINLKDRGENIQDNGFYFSVSTGL
jgi:hemolysin activation/secretion protein